MFIDLVVNYVRDLIGKLWNSSEDTIQLNPHFDSVVQENAWLEYTESVNDYYNQFTQ